MVLICSHKYTALFVFYFTLYSSTLGETGSLLRCAVRVVECAFVDQNLPAGRILIPTGKTSGYGGPPEQLDGNKGRLFDRTGNYVLDRNLNF